MLLLFKYFALVGNAGPFLAPFYLSYRLVKGAFIVTEALGTAVMHIMKLSTYHELGAISPATWLNGITIGLIMIIVEVALIVFGLWFLSK